MAFYIVCALTAGCAALYSNPTGPIPTESIEYWPTESWLTSTPEQQGMDSLVLANMLEAIQEMDLDYHSIVVVRNGYIVLEAYAHPYQPDTLHEIASVTKSVTSALVGMSIDQGYIESVDQSVLDFFPLIEIANIDARKQTMTLEHLLTMKSGMEWPQNESTYPGSAVFSQMEQSEDWIQFLLDRPTSSTPGSFFNYNSGASHLLSAIVHQATGMTTLEFAKAHLFAPLGISNVVWRHDPSGIAVGGYGLQMTPRDMAKFGYLYLNNGSWDGRQVLPSDWVSVSIEDHSGVSSFGGSGYGYQWWLQSFGGYAAVGWGGQRIYVIPDQEIVVIFTSSTNDSHNSYVGLYIRRAVKSSDPLPANPQDVAFLESLIAEIGRPPEPESVPSLPQIAHDISGRTYDLEENRSGWHTFGLSFEGQEALFMFTFGDFFDEVYTEVRVGLDNVPRITTTQDPWVPGSYISWASKGYWHNEDTFLLELTVLGTPFRNETTFIFDQEGGVTIQNRDMVSMQFDVIPGVVRD